MYIWVRVPTDRETLKKQKSMKKTIQFWKKSLSENCAPCVGGIIIPMRGFSRSGYFYLCVPCSGVFFRAANIGRYGPYMLEVFIDGRFIGASQLYKREKIEKLYKSGSILEAVEYALGYRLWRETTLGGYNIIPAKERARISHLLCDESGKAGHVIRQRIRKHLKYM